MPKAKNKEAVVSEYFAELASALAKSMTPEERNERATKAALARWGKKKPPVALPRKTEG